MKSFSPRRNSPSSRSPRATFLAGATTILLAGSALTMAACDDEDTTPSEAASTSSAEADGDAGQSPADGDGSANPTAPAANANANGNGNNSKADDGSVGKNGMCATNSLKITTADQQGAAGSTLINVVFENTSNEPCSMRGFPGVSLVTNNNGTQLGKPAKRETGAPDEAVKLAPGASGVAGLKISNPGVMDPEQCKPQQADGLRVYPPEQTKAAYVPMKGLEGCSGDVEFLSVQPVGPKS